MSQIEQGGYVRTPADNLALGRMIHGEMATLRRNQRHGLLAMVPPALVDDHDLMQIAWSKAIEQAPHFDQSRGVPLTGFLKPYVRGAMMDYLRRIKAGTRTKTPPVLYFDAPLSDNEDGPLTLGDTIAAPDDYDGLLVRLSLADTFKALKPKEQFVIARHIEGFTSAEIAMEMGISTNAIQQRLATIRKKLKVLYPDLIELVY